MGKESTQGMQNHISLKHQLGKTTKTLTVLSMSHLDNHGVD